jgi:hypothetical protein
MRISEVRCDRCGKTIDSTSHFYFSEKAWDCDLCERCFKDFQSWVKVGKLS